MIKSFKQYISEVKSEGVVFTFGRFNPPHIGHETLCDVVAKIAGRDKYFIFVSQSQDPKKNPLDYATKVKTCSFYYHGYISEDCIRCSHTFVCKGIPQGKDDCRF